MVGGEKSDPIAEVRARSCGRMVRFGFAICKLGKQLCLFERMLTSGLLGASSPGRFVRDEACVHTSGSLTWRSSL
jgi:hypothetical protein